MKVNRGEGRVNPSKTKGLSKGGNFFVPKKSTPTKPESSKPQTSSDSFFVKKNDAAKNKPNKLASKNQSGTFHKGNKSKKGNASNSKEEESKKPFNKKKWRLQKYSNKYKVEQWAEKRKHAVIKDYRRQVDENAPKLDVGKIYQEYENDIAALQDDGDDQGDQTEATASNAAVEMQNAKSENENNVNTNASMKRFSKNAKLGKEDQGKQKKMLFRKERLAFERTKMDREVKKKEALRKQNERDAALKIYKEKKLIKSKKLNQKTKKGQPIMKGRIEMLLEQIQASKATEN